MKIVSKDDFLVVEIMRLQASHYYITVKTPRSLLGKLREGIRSYLNIILQYGKLKIAYHGFR